MGKIKILIIGAGIITKGIVKNLCTSKKYSIFLYSKHLKYMEAVKIIKDIKEIKKHDIIITCFKNDLEASKFWNEIEKNKIDIVESLILDLTTSSIKNIKKRKEKIEKMNGFFIESPITGSRIGSEKGELYMFIHHNLSRVDKIEILKEILNKISKKIYLFEESSAPTKFKLIYNSWGAMILYSVKIFNPKKFLFSEKDEVICTNIIEEYGWMADVCKSKLKKINLELFDEVDFKLEYMIKDLQYSYEGIKELRDSDLFNLIYNKYINFSQDKLDLDFSIIAKK